MQFSPPAGLLSGLSDIHGFVDWLTEYVAAMRAIQPSTHLTAFLGSDKGVGEYRTDRIDHVAAYAGDYRFDREFDAWFDRLQDSGCLSSVQTGPSYIAPREYGTQGYWISAQFAGAGIELFAIKRAGIWQDFSASKKASRMSHVALAVDICSHVRLLLNHFSQYPHIATLSYSSTDVLNHTYGHLLNTLTDSVLEFVHAESPELSSAHESRTLQGVYCAE